jgi:hypothetical protein
LSSGWRGGGGGCLDGGFPSSVSSAWVGGGGGRVFIDVGFSYPAATESRSVVRVAANLDASGGGCDARRTPNPGLSPDVSQFDGGAGGTFDLLMTNHSIADLHVTSPQIDLSGGGSATIEGSSSLYASAGNGGTFSFIGSGGGAARSRFVGVDVATSGGEAVADQPTNLFAGDAGAFIVIDDGPMSSLITDETSSVTQNGGNATVMGTATQVVGGAGGLLLIAMVGGAPAFDPAFTSCVFPTPDAGAPGGTASGAASVSSSGVTGACLWETGE